MFVRLTICEFERAGFGAEVGRYGEIAVIAHTKEKGNTDARAKRC